MPKQLTFSAKCLERAFLQMYLFFFLGFCPICDISRHHQIFGVNSTTLCISGVVSELVTSRIS